MRTKPKEGPPEDGEGVHYGVYVENPRMVKRTLGIGPIQNTDTSAVQRVSKVRYHSQNQNSLQSASNTVSPQTKEYDFLI